MKRNERRNTASTYPFLFHFLRATNPFATALLQIFINIFLEFESICAPSLHPHVNKVCKLCTDKCNIQKLCVTLGPSAMALRSHFDQRIHFSTRKTNEEKKLTGQCNLLVVLNRCAHPWLFVADCSLLFHHHFPSMCRRLLWMKHS